MALPESRVFAPPIRTTFVGPVVAGAVWLLIGVLWFSRDVHPPLCVQRAVGEFLGISAVYLIALAMFLAIDWAVMDRHWGGVEARSLIHKIVGSVGFVLSCVHPIVTEGGPFPASVPRLLGLVAVILMGITVIISVMTQLVQFMPFLRKLPFPLRWLVDPPFDMWRMFHDLLGIYLAMVLVHGYFMSRVIRFDMAFLVVFIIIGVFGLGSWLYAAILQRYVLVGRRMVVTGVRPLADYTAEITMEPIDARPLALFRPGQYMKVTMPGVLHGPHPFTEVSAPGRDVLQFAVRVVGTDTRVLHEKVGVGVEVRVRGPYGDLDVRRATPRQLWVAGGVGITPFVSWLRSIDALVEEKVRRSGVASRKIRKVAAEEALDQLGISRVDLWYFHHNEPAYVEALRYWEEHFEWLGVHVHNTLEGRRMTAEQTVAATPGMDVDDTKNLSAVICGPRDMLRSYTADLRALGVKPVLKEDFSFR